jgi:hypothetical protein
VVKLMAASTKHEEAERGLVTKGNGRRWKHRGGREERR